MRDKRTPKDVCGEAKLTIESGHFNKPLIKLAAHQKKKRKSIKALVIYVKKGFIIRSYAHLPGFRKY